MLAGAWIRWPWRDITNREFIHDVVTFIRDGLTFICDSVSQLLRIMNSFFSRGPEGARFEPNIDRSKGGMEGENQPCTTIKHVGLPCFSTCVLNETVGALFGSLLRIWASGAASGVATGDWGGGQGSGGSTPNKKENNYAYKCFKGIVTIRAAFQQGMESVSYSLR